MPTVSERMIADARRLVLALNQSGYQVDFSIESLQEIDRFLDEQTLGGQPRPGGLLSANLKSRMRELGAYVGEVIRRNRGGQWTTDHDGARNSAPPVLQFPDGTILRPHDRILTRIHRGPEAGIAAWFWHPVQPSGNSRTAVATAPAANGTTPRASRQRPYRDSVNIAHSGATEGEEGVPARHQRFWWCVAAAVAVWLGMSFVGGMYRPLGIAAIVIGVVASLGFVAFSWWLALSHAWRNKPILVPFFFLPLYFIKYSLRSWPETKLALIMLGAGIATSTAIFTIVIPTRMVGEVLGSIIFDESKATEVAESPGQPELRSQDPRRSMPPPIPVVPIPADPFLTPPGVMPGPGHGKVSYPESIDQALQDLEASDPNQRRRALYYLLRPSHDHDRTDVADKFLAILEHDFDPRLVDGLIAWGSASHLAGMTNVARRLETFQLSGLLRAILRIDRATGIDLALERFEDPRSRMYASFVLSEIGADAEPGLLKLIGHTDSEVRQEASRLLRFAGGSASLQPLAQQIAVESDRSARQSMESALRSIERRTTRE